MLMQPAAENTWHFGEDALLLPSGSPGEVQTQCIKCERFSQGSSDTTGSRLKLPAQFLHPFLRASAEIVVSAVVCGIHGNSMKISNVNTI